VVSNLINTYPDSFEVIEYHVEDSYDTPWGNARSAFYNIWSDGIPWFAYDGLFDAWPINTYESKFLDRRAVPTDVTLDLVGEMIDTETIRVVGHVCIEDDGEAETMRLYTVQVLDHWPSSPSYSRNTFKQAATTLDVSIQPGECATFERTFTLDSDSASQLDDVKIMAWAQEPLGGIPAKIFQGQKLLQPLAPFEDCNDNGMPDGWDIDDGVSEDANGNGVPDECESGPCPADFDGSGAVNVTDLLQLLGAWGQSGGPEDLNGDGVVNVLDLLVLLDQWGVC
jgi:hypothetical protein